MRLSWLNTVNSSKVGVEQTMLRGSVRILTMACPIKVSATLNRTQRRFLSLIFFFLWWCILPTMMHHDPHYLTTWLLWLGLCGIWLWEAHAFAMFTHPVSSLHNHTRNLKDLWYHNCIQKVNLMAHNGFLLTFHQALQISHTIKCSCFSRNPV